MPSSATLPSGVNQPEENDNEKRKEVFSALVKAYNGGCEQGGVEEGFRHLYQKLDELSPRPYKVREPLLDHFVGNSMT